MHIKTRRFSIFLLLLFLVSVLFFGRKIIWKSVDSKHSSTKIERWQKMEKEVAHWGDALGKGIDPGIKKIVTVLNLLNFKTEQSCEGHINWGRPYPWVRIATSDSELDASRNEWRKMSKSINEQERKIQEKYPELALGEALRKENSQELNEMYKKRRLLSEEMERKSKVKVVPLRNLIADFYKSQPTDTDKMLVISRFGFYGFELFSFGGEWQIMRDEADKIKKLKEYKKEMSLFADFLTDYYFGSSEIRY